MGQQAKAMPVSAHPAFPAIVALWFAALFGLGSLIVPTALYDLLVDVTGLTAVIPAAAPPLGFTAKSVIALVIGSLGAVAGFMLGRAVARSHRSPAIGRRAEEGQLAFRPISAKDELGSESIDAPLADEQPAPAAEADALELELPVELGRPQNPKHVPGRRRALAVHDESSPSEFLYSVPLPGADTSSDGAPIDSNPAPQAGQELPMSDDLPEISAPSRPTALRQIFQPIRSSEEEDEIALDLGRFDTDAAPADEMAEGGAGAPAQPAELRDQPAPFVANSALDPRASNTNGQDQDDGQAAPFAPPPRPAPMQMQDFAALDDVESLWIAGYLEDEPEAPLPFAPPSLAKARPVDDREQVEALEVHGIEQEGGLESAASKAKPQDDTDSDGPDADRPLDRLGLVELVERLGRGLTKAPPAARAQAAAPQPEQDGLAHLARLQKPSAPEPAVTEPAKAAARPSTFATPFAALDPQGGHEDDMDDEDEDLGLTFPRTAVAQTSISFDTRAPTPAPFAAPAPPQAPFAKPFDPPASAEDDEEEAPDDESTGAADETGADGQYPSLLAMRDPARLPQEFVRIDEPDSGSQDFAQPGPVVFPGQETSALAEASPAEASAENAAPQVSGAAPFDSNSTAPRPDTQASQEALRQALAGLRRMNKAG